METFDKLANSLKLLDISPLALFEEYDENRDG